MNWSGNLLGEAETRVEVFHVMGIHPGIHPLQNRVPQATQAQLCLLPSHEPPMVVGVGMVGPHRLTHLNV